METRTIGFEHKSCKASFWDRINAKHFFVLNFSIFESGAIAFAIRFVLRLKFFRKCRRLSKENYLPQAIRGGFVCFALARKKRDTRKSARVNSAACNSITQEKMGNPPTAQTRNTARISSFTPAQKYVSLQNCKTTKPRMPNSTKL